MSTLRGMKPRKHWRELAEEDNSGVSQGRHFGRQSMNNDQDTQGSPGESRRCGQRQKRGSVKDQNVALD